uniref:Uncharacterized protein n=1 Tax=Hucho hucho TaxID=62062 RepID=A0A4W5NVN9_9TELE
MVVRGAHLTTAYHRQSIFKVLVQDSLMGVVRPTLRHAVESNPSRNRFLWQGFDEIYAVLDVFLQHHFLQKCVAASGHEWTAHLGLRWKQHWRSLVLLGLVPYLRAFLAAYTYVSMGWNSWVFCQQLLSMFDRAKTHSPFLWLVGVRLAHLTGHDITNMDLKPATPSMTIGSRNKSPINLNCPSGTRTSR